MSTLIPTGELRSVAGTPFDFRRAVSIGSRIGARDEQLTFGHGYDHNWVAAPAPAGPAQRLAAVLSAPSSGRVMEIHTTQPGLQFSHSGNFLNGKPSGEGSVYGYRTGLCLETQHFPIRRIIRPSQIPYCARVRPTPRKPWLISVRRLFRASKVGWAHAISAS